MEAAALQNVWVDKSLYDEAECIFYQKSFQGEKSCSNSVANNVWTDKSLYDEAECSYYEKLSKLPETPKGLNPKPSSPHPSDLAQESCAQKSSKKNKKAKKNNKSKNETSDIVQNVTETEELKIEKVQEKPDKGNKNKESKKKRKESEKDDKGDSSQAICSQSSLASEVAKARQHIKNSLECMDTVLSSVNNSTVLNTSTLNSTILEMKNMMLNFQSEINTLKEHVATLKLTVTKISQ